MYSKEQCVVQLTFYCMNVYFDNHSGGGYVITPMDHGKRSLVKHMLAADWKFWKCCLPASSARSITIRMLERVAGALLLIEKELLF